MQIDNIWIWFMNIYDNFIQFRQNHLTLVTTSDNLIMLHWCQFRSKNMVSMFFWGVWSRVAFTHFTAGFLDTGASIAKIRVFVSRYCRQKVTDLRRKSSGCWSVACMWRRWLFLILALMFGFKGRDLRRNQVKWTKEQKKCRQRILYIYILNHTY